MATGSSLNETLDNYPQQLMSKCVDLCIKQELPVGHSSGNADHHNDKDTYGDSTSHLNDAYSHVAANNVEGPSTSKRSFDNQQYEDEFCAWSLDNVKTEPPLLSEQEFKYVTALDQQGDDDEHKIDVNDYTLATNPPDWCEDTEKGFADGKSLRCGKGNVNSKLFSSLHVWKTEDTCLEIQNASEIETSQNRSTESRSFTCVRKISHKHNAETLEHGSTETQTSLATCVKKVLYKQEDKSEYVTSNNEHSLRKRTRTLKSNANIDAYKCFQCKYSTRYKSNLSRHLTAKHGRGAKVYACSECDSVFNRKRKLAVHSTIQHALSNEYVCAYCDYVTERKINLVNHFKRKCCNKPAANPESESEVGNDPKTEPLENAQASIRGKRQATARNGRLRVSNIVIYKCPECEYTSRYSSHVTNHAKIIHNPNAVVYECPDCKYTTKYKPAMRQHVQLNHSSNLVMYKCPDCDFTSKYASCLRTHTKTVHDPNAKLYHCSECDFATKYNRTLVTHTRAKHQPHADRYKCPQCEYTTRYKSHVGHHVKIKHSAQQVLYECPQCDHTTAYKSQLKKHARLKHSPDVKMHKCGECEFTSKYKYSVVMHARTKHSGDAEVFGCSECGFRTKYKTHLSTHVRVKHNENAEVYRCSLCAYTSRYKANLTTHVTVKHDPEACVYACRECEFKSKRNGELMEHVRSTHG